MMDLLTWWISILTVIFLMESAAIVYFVRWILWRWNTTVQELLVAHYSDSESDNEEE